MCPHGYEHWTRCQQCFTSLVVPTAASVPQALPGAWIGMTGGAQAQQAPTRLYTVERVAASVYGRPGAGGGGYAASELYDLMDACRDALAKEPT